MSRLIVPWLLSLLAVAGPSSADDAVAPADAATAKSVDAEPAPTLATPAPAPRWSANVAAHDGGYRLSLSRGSLDMGMQFEPRLAAARPIDARYDSAAPPGATLPSLSLGLRSVAAGPAPAGSLVERVLGSAAESEVKKIGIEWKPAQSRVFFNRGVGVRLGGEDRLVMRLRGGSIGIYMQRKF